MHYLVATASVHTSAAACDFLTDRLAPDDVVTVLGVDEDGPTDASRDLDDALNVANVRLPGAEVDTERRSGIPSDAILAVVAERDVDHVVMGARRGVAGATGLGGTTATVLVEADVPVTVVPVDL